MSIWDVRLEGGPHDGDFSLVDWEAPVPQMYVRLCPSCNDTHYYSSPSADRDRYVRDEVDDEARTAKYVHTDLAGGPALEERKKELAPA